MRFYANSCSIIFYLSRFKWLSREYTVETPRSKFTRKSSNKVRQPIRVWLSLACDQSSWLTDKHRMVTARSIFYTANCSVYDENQQRFIHRSTRFKIAKLKMLFRQTVRFSRSNQLFCAVSMTQISMGGSLVSWNSCGTSVARKRSDAWRILRLSHLMA